MLIYVSTELGSQDASSVQEPAFMLLLAWVSDQQ